MTLLRSLIFQLYFIILTLVMGIGALPLRALRHRRYALTYAQLWSHLTLKGLEKICGIKTVVTGREHIPDQPCIIASQHQSFFDGFVWMNLVPRPAYIFKQELTRVPFVGPLLLLSGMIPIERSAGPRALRALIRHTQSAFEEKRQVIIFPQGTRTAPGEHGPLQPGIIALAKQAKVPVVPVATNSGLFWPKKGWRKDPGQLQIIIGQKLHSDDGRGRLTASIEESWRALSSKIEGNRPVDNSVDAR